jgi:POT family proton-dependent oligopeptide transporter
VTLAGVEMWERFSFYGLQVVLAYYLYYSLTDGGLGLPTATALGVTGSYGGVVYIAQVLGAWVADRVLAARTTVLVAGTLILLGHVVLAAVRSGWGVAVGLGLIVLGTGGLKVNATAMVGDLYRDDQDRRDAGFSFYYTGIAVGSSVGPLLTGLLQDRSGFHVAFAAAAVGMAVGLVQYVVGWNRLPRSTRLVPNPLDARAAVRAGVVLVVAVAVLALVVGTGLLTLDRLPAVTTAAVVVASVAYFTLLLTARGVTPAERRGVVRYVPVFGASLVFWTMLFQLFTTFSLYADTRLDLTVAGVTVPPATVVTAQGFLTIAAAPLVGLFWLRRNGPAIPPLVKATAGLVAIAGGYAVFLLGAGTTGAVNPLWLALVGFLLFSVAEAVVPAVAMSATTAAAPQRFASQTLSLYFLTMAGGSALSGLLAQLYSPAHEVAFFGSCALGTLAAAGLLLAAGRRGGWRA